MERRTGAGRAGWPAGFLALTGAGLACWASLLAGSGQEFPEILRFYLLILTVPPATLAGHRIGWALSRSTGWRQERGSRPSYPVSREPAEERPPRSGPGLRMGVRARATSFTAVVALTVGLLSAGPAIPPTVSWLAGGLRVAGVLLSAAVIVFGLRTLFPIDRGLRWFWLLLLTPFVPSSGGALLLFGIVSGLLLASACCAGLKRSRPGGGSPARAPGLEVWLFLPLLTLVLTDRQAGAGPLDLYHLGERMTPAGELLAGEVAFRDVYLQHGWIENVLRTRASFALLGDTLDAELKGYAFLIALGNAVFLLLCLAAFRSWWLALALTLALATPGFGSAGRLIGLALTLTFLLLDLQQARDSAGAPRRNRRRTLLGCAGLASGAGLFLSLETGLYALGAAVVFLLLESLGRGERIGVRWAAFSRFGLGWLVGVLPFVIALVANGALPAFVRNSIAQVTHQLPVWGLPFPPLSRLLDPWRSEHGSFGAWLGSAQLLALVTASALVLSLTWLLLRAARGRLDRAGYRLLLFSLAGALLFRSALGRSDPGHFVFAAALLWPLLVLIARRFRKAQLLPLGLLAGWMLVSQAPVYGMVQQVLRLSYPPHDAATGDLCRLPLARAGRVLLPLSQARPLAALASDLDELLPPRAAFFDFSNIAAAYFLLDRDCPTRFFVPIYASSEAQQLRLIEELERVRPRYALCHSPLGHPALDGRAMEDRLPLVAEYIERHYAPGRRRSYGELRKRRALSARESSGAPAARPADPPEEARPPAGAGSRTNRR